MDIEDIIEEKYTNWLNCETDEIDLTIEEAKFILANDEKMHFVDGLLFEAYKVVLSELEKQDKRLNRQFKLLQKKDKEIEDIKELLEIVIKGYIEEYIINLDLSDSTKNVLKRQLRKTFLDEDLLYDLVTIAYKNSIPKSKVKEKIEEIKNEDLEIYDTDSEDVKIAKYEQRAVLDICEELLGKE